MKIAAVATMRIGLLQLDLYFAGCDSLKDKRAILQSIKTRLRARHNVSLAEIGDFDVWRRSQFGAVAIGNEADSIERIFRAVTHEIECRDDTEIADSRVEML